MKPLQAKIASIIVALLLVAPMLLLGINALLSGRP